MNLKIGKTGTKVFLFIFGILAVCVLFILLFNSVEKKKPQSEDSREARGAVFYKGRQYIPSDSVKTLLLIGVDKFKDDSAEQSYNNNEQSDFLMLLLLDRNNKSFRIIPINRDTLAEIPVLGVTGEDAGSIRAQLALAHTYGSGGRDSCRNTLKAVSDYLYGIKIDHYAAFSLDAVPKLTDAVGGVQLTLLSDFSAVNPAMQKGILYTLNGNDALTYLRQRMYVGEQTNLERMERQKQYLGELKKLIAEREKKEKGFSAELLSELSKYVISDCSVNELNAIYKSCLDAKDDGFVEIPGKAVKGKEFIEFYADEERLTEIVIENFYVPYAKK